MYLFKVSIPVVREERLKAIIDLKIYFENRITYRYVGIEMDTYALNFHILKSNFLGYF